MAGDLLIYPAEEALNKLGAHVIHIHTAELVFTKFSIIYYNCSSKISFVIDEMQSIPGWYLLLFQLILGAESKIRV